MKKRITHFLTEDNVLACDSNMGGASGLQFTRDPEHYPVTCKRCLKAQSGISLADSYQGTSSEGIMKDRNELLLDAMKRDKEVTCDDFKGDVRIRHLDGSLVDLATRHAPRFCLGQSGTW